MRLVDADAFAMYLQLVCKGNDMSAEKKVFSANGIIHMLQDMPTASDIKWIPVTEKLPERTHDVLVTVFEQNTWKYVSIDSYHPKVDDWENNGEEVTAWMPLPEPYEVEDGSN